MKNGHDKLIAKIQHFYDLLTQREEERGAEAVSKDSFKKRTESASLMKEAIFIKDKYKEIFKEFLYDEENDDVS